MQPKQPTKLSPADAKAAYATLIRKELLDATLLHHTPLTVATLAIVGRLPVEAN